VSDGGLFFAMTPGPALTATAGKPIATHFVMKWVYFLQSVKNPDQNYVGITSELNERLQDHNWGRSRHSRKYRPWKIIVALQIHDDSKAKDFEKYLKSGSGRAFVNRHFK
jgi:predicted GIY-YIG superfamily endonuclease